MAETQALALLGPTYDPVRDDIEYCRALLSPKDLATLKDSVASDGFLTIEDVRALVATNTVKETMEARGEIYAVDPELMMQIDTRINFNVFIAGDNVYTREELFVHYPFDTFQTEPERVFVQQEIGVFPPKTNALKAGEYDYAARDIDDEDEFIMIEDLVGRAARKNYKMRRAPLKIVKTKIFLGKQQWEDFSMMQRLVRVFRQFAGPLLEGGEALSFLTGRGAPLALQDAGTAETERRIRAVAALEAKAAALKRKEEELRAREEALFRSLGIEPAGDPPPPQEGLDGYIDELLDGPPDVPEEADSVPI